MAVLLCDGHMAEPIRSDSDALYCPNCEKEVPNPLVCGDCGAVICRTCGTPLEKIDELGIG
jgi:primosomal protein N'